MTWLGRSHSTGRLVLVCTFLLSLYVLVQQPEVRDVYSAWDKVFHAGVFFMVWGLLRWCWISSPWVLSMACLALGILVEVHQYFMPGFDASAADWLADAFGIFMAHRVLGWMTVDHKDR